MRLGLGTAQFGANYGISNVSGKPPPSEVQSILRLAGESGVRLIDTSPQYGDSEEVLGQLLPARHDFKIVTKTIKCMRDLITEAEADLLEETFLRSLRRLRQPSVYGLLVHQLDDLLARGGELLIGRLQSLKSRGLVTKIGLSLSRFTEQEIDRALGKFPIDLIQVPLSILDQRLIASGRLRKLKAAGIEVHARSVFLQGLLLMRPEELSMWFDPVKLRLRAYHDEIAGRGMSPTQAALGFVLDLNDVDAVVCGINDSEQLRELIGCEHDAAREKGSYRFGAYAIDDVRILNPTNWRIGNS